MADADGVDEIDWQPVLQAGGRVLGLDGQGRWVLGDGPGRVHPLDWLVPLLPMLELHYAEVERATAGVPADPPWEELLRLALTSGSDYWSARALDWLEGGHPVSALLGVLDEVGRTGATQRTRHCARRLWKDANQGLESSAAG